jgi:transposase InsO family protein
MTPNQYIIQRKLSILELGNTLGNISEACRKMGASRQHYYDIKTTLAEEGIEGLIEKTRRAPRHSNRVDEQVEERILAYSLEWPTHGQVRVSNELKQKGIIVSPGGIRGVWLRHGLEVKAQRLKRLEKWAAENTNVLTETQVQALESAKEEKQAQGEIETFHPGYLFGQDTFYAAWIKGIGKIFQQTGIDTFSNVAFAKLYTEKTALTATDFLNERVLPFFDGHGIRLLRTLTDRGTEYCGIQDQHPYELFCYLSDVEHTRTKARHPQTNGCCERMNQIILDEFWQVAFRKKIYRTLEEIQTDLDTYMIHYNEVRTNQGRHCDGRTPMQTFLEGKPLCDRYVPKNDGQECPIDDSLKNAGGTGTPVFQGQKDFSVETVH